MQEKNTENQLIQQLQETLDRERHFKRVLEGVRNVNQLITKTTDSMELIQRAPEILSASMGYYNAWIVLFDENMKVIAFASSGLEGNHNRFSKQLEEGKLPDCIKKAVRQKKLIIQNDPPVQCPDCLLSGKYHERAGLCHLIEYNELVYGAIVVSAPGRFAELREEHDLLKEVAYDIGFALHNMEIRKAFHAAHNLIKKNEESLRITLRSIGDGVISTDHQGMVTKLNPVAEKLTGWKQEEAFGKPLQDVFCIVHATTRKKVKNPVETVLKTGKTVGLANHTALISKDGKEYQIADTAAPIVNDSGEIEGVVLVFSDVTDKYQQLEAVIESEEKFRTLINISSDALFINQNNQVVFVNPAAITLFGVNGVEDLLGRSPFELFHPDDHELIRNRIRYMLSEGHSVDPVEERIVRSDGSIVPVEVIASPFILKGSLAIQVILRDITPRKKAEAALRKQHLFFEQVFLQSSISTQILDPDGWCVRINPKLTELFGVEPQDIEGGKYNIFKDEMVIRAGVTEHLKKVFEQRVPAQWEVEFDIGIAADSQNIQVKDKVTKWFRNWAFPVIDDNGKLLNVIIQHTDVTREKEYIEKLKTSDKIFNHSLDMLCVAGYDGYFKSLNPAWERILGWTTEELLSRPWVEFVHPDDRESTERIGSTIIDGQEVFRFENRYVCKDGTEKWLSWNSFPYPDEKIMFGVARDITEFRKNMQVQGVIYRIASSLMLSKDMEDFVSVIAHELSSIINTSNFYIALYNRETDMLTIPYEKDEKDNIETWPASRSATGLAIKRRQSVLLRKQDVTDLVDAGIIDLIGTPSEVWLGIPLYRDGEVFGVLAVQNYERADAFDESSIELLEFVSGQVSLALQRKLAYNELLEAKNKAEKSDRLKTSFLNNLSHEIRTPMNAIMGYSEILNEPGLDREHTARLTAIISNSSRQLLNIINDILSISSIEEGLMELNEVRTDIRKLCEDINAQFDIQANQKNLRLRSSMGLSPAVSWVLADHTKLTQVLTNLLDNAIKFTDAGRVEFGCNLHDDFIRFYVADSGIGIEKKHHEAIFERFRQLEIDLSRKKAGIGLGLPISKSFVELMGGSMWVESAPGEGSVFYFTIPYKPVHAVGEAEGADKKKSIKPGTILVAEDEINNFELTRTILEMDGHMVLHAANGLEAVEAVQRNASIDLVLMDIKMPVMNGYEATRNIRKYRKTLPIIAMTAYALPGDREKAMDAGCVDYLAKPVGVNNLLNIIQKHL